MSKTNFYYSRKEGEKEFKDSFNVNKLIRTREMEDGTVLVVLDDFHEEMREVPGFHPKTRKPTGVYVKERNVYQSEIILSKEDGQRLVKIISVD
jgi:hypothetical protein